MRQVSVDVQVKGQLLVQPTGKPNRQLPIIAKGQLRYEERTAKDVALRYYRAADAHIVVAEGGISPALDGRRKLIAVDLTTPRPTLYSPHSPLSRAELELLDVQGNTAVLDRLLPGRRVKVGDKWEDSPDVLAALLALDAVHQSNSSSTLLKVEDNIAVVEFGGQLCGSVAGTPTDLNLAGTYCYDLTARRMASLALVIEEKRAIGPAEPGFEVSARIEVLIDRLQQSDALGDEALAAALRSSDKSENSLLLSHASADAGMRLLHGRRWRLMHENGTTAVFRLIDLGDVLAQCNLHRLADLPAGKRPTLDEFKADVKKSLGTHFGEFQEAAADVTATGLRRLRVTVSGVVAEVPIRWIYFHLSDDAGRQASCIFTLQQDRLAQLAGDDLRITGTIALDNRPASPRTSAKPKEPAGSGAAK
ncbi:MAG: hypothetical protein WEH44_04605 [Pirellulaceae bacterium]